MDALLAHILEAAGRAPSAHNTQPWVLRWSGDTLEVSIRQERTLPAIDPAGVDILHSLGAMLENVLLTLAHLGYEAEYQVSDHTGSGAPALSVRWSPSSGASPDPTLYRMMPIRRTSRLPYAQESIPPEVLLAIRAAVKPPCFLHVLTDPVAIERVRQLTAEATVEQLAISAAANELYQWMRFSRHDRRWYRDGLNVACMGWKPWEAVVAKIVLSPKILNVLVRMGLHRALCSDVDKQVPPAPALCLLAVEGEGTIARIEAGRCLQRVWLTAAAHGLVTHPLSAAIDIAATRPRVLGIFGVPPGQRHVNLFRLGRSANPARSPRLPADEIFSILPAPQAKASQ